MEHQHKYAPTEDQKREYVFLKPYGVQIVTVKNPIGIDEKPSGAHEVLYQTPGGMYDSTYLAEGYMVIRHTGPDGEYSLTVNTETEVAPLNGNHYRAIYSLDWETDPREWLEGGGADAQDVMDGNEEVWCQADKKIGTCLLHPECSCVEQEPPEECLGKSRDACEYDDCDCRPMKGPPGDGGMGDPPVRTSRNKPSNNK